MPSIPHLFPFSFAILVLALAACGSASQTLSSTAVVTRPAAKATGPTLARPLPGAYAALGDSVTFGIGAQPFSRGYAYQVARSLRAKTFRNTGIPAATLPAAYDLELPTALAIRPTLATVFFGYNDIAQGVKRATFLQDLHDLVATLRRARAQVLIIGLPDISLLPAVQRSLPHLHGTVTSWNAGMAAIAHQTGAHFLDLHAYTAELAAHPNYVAADGLHPSNLGHTRLARVVLAAIRAAHLWTPSK